MEDDRRRLVSFSPAPTKLPPVLVGARDTADGDSDERRGLGYRTLPPAVAAAAAAAAAAAEPTTAAPPTAEELRRFSFSSPITDELLRLFWVGSSPLTTGELLRRFWISAPTTDELLRRA